MNKPNTFKWLILVALVAWSLVIVYPPDEKIKLGLDLRGGTSFVLEVDDSELDADARRDAQARALEIIRNRVDAMGMAEPIIYPEPNSMRIVVQIPGLAAADRERAVSNLKSAAFLEFRMVHARNDQLVDELFADGATPPGYRIISIDDAGPAGQWRRGNYYVRDEQAPPPADPEAEREALRSFHAPSGYDLLLEESEIRGQKVYTPYFVSRRGALTGENLSNAGVDFQQFGQAIVTLKFDARGARRFANLTSDYAPGGAKNPGLDSRRYLAIVLDGKLYSAPFIKSAIHGGNAIIEGSFSQKEAQDLALVLRAGSLPAPVNVIEERGVDPSLGRDSVRSGARAAVMAGVAVLLFMLVYYRFAGLIANLALLLDLLLLPLGMMITSGFLGLLSGGGGAYTSGAISLPTLTLPGLAGLVLTLGMAVDANVLIFERIREELADGKRLVTAISAGYEKAFSTIFDANITTLLTAAILFWQGSGPVRGFAVMLSAGIVVSMFTVLFGTRLFFNLATQSGKRTTLPMLHLLDKTHIDFVSKRKLAGLISIALILVTGVIFGLRFQSNFGVDFTGGKALSLRFDDKVPTADIRNALTAAGIGEALIQYQREVLPDEETETREFLEIKVDFESGDLAKEALLTEFADQGYRVVKEDSVGPQIGRELQRRGLMALGLALLGIVIYISLRFEFAFAMGAIAALAHDVLITVGLYCLFGRQLSLPIVAALLTIVGYSVNDTIVVFDRIREDLKLHRGKPYGEIANLSINQTLSRTILTSLTTLLSVLILFLFGGGAINDFALALLIGVLVGTYSSVFIATPVMLWWHPVEPRNQD